MIFDIDRQTLADLGLFNNRKDEKSIFSFYNRAATKGGQEMLHKMFRTPVSDIELLEDRKEEFNVTNNLIIFINQIESEPHERLGDANHIHLSA